MPQVGRADVISKFLSLKDFNVAHVKLASLYHVPRRPPTQRTFSYLLFRITPSPHLLTPSHSFSQVPRLDVHMILTNDRGLQTRLQAPLQAGVLYTQRYSPAEKAEQFRLYRECCLPLLTSFYSGFKTILGGGQDEIMCRDLFFWSVLVDHGKLIKTLLPHCEAPIHMAALGAYTCTQLAGRLPSSNVRGHATHSAPPHRYTSPRCTVC